MATPERRWATTVAWVTSTVQGCLADETPRHRRENCGYRVVQARTQEDEMATLSPIDLQKALKGMDYPAKKEDIVRKAEDNGADGEIVDALRQIPDREYEGPSGVSAEVFDDKG
jgi:hypothetical protein